MWKLRKARRTYLDAAAGVSGNPSSPHEEGRGARAALERARMKIARLAQSKAEDVIFTSGATEANALAILGRARAARAAGIERPHLLYLSCAHASVVENVKLAAREGAVPEPLPIRGRQVDCDALARMLRPETVLVSMDAVCGETGVVWNARAVSRVIETRAGRRAPGMRPMVHVDASQAALTEKVARAHFGADAVTFDASKVCEARGIGCLIAPRTMPLAPLYGGGGQERGLRPGSGSPALAQSFAAGLARAAQARESFRTAAQAARARLLAPLYEGIPGILVNEGPADAQAPHILNVSLPGRDTDYLAALLDEAGFAVSTRSACESDSSEGSRAVLALFGDGVRALSTLRVSWGSRIHRRDLDRFAEALIRAVAFVDSPGRS